MEKSPEVEDKAFAHSRQSAVSTERPNRALFFFYSKRGSMTGQQLLIALQAMDSNELRYTVLIEGPDGWVQLDSIKKDFEMKSLDLQAEEKE